MRSRWGGSLRKPVGTRVMELLFGRGAIWLGGIFAGVGVLVVAVVLGTTAGAIVAIPFVLAVVLAIRVKERTWIVGRRIIVRRDRISRRQVLAMTISIAIVAGVTTGLGWVVGASVRRSYEEQIRRRLRAKPK